MFLRLSCTATKYPELSRMCALSTNSRLLAVESKTPLPSGESLVPSKWVRKSTSCCALSASSAGRWLQEPTTDGRELTIVLGAWGAVVGPCAPHQSSVQSTRVVA